MDKPIERVVQAASGTAGNSRTFQNSESAELYGLEVDGRFEFALGEGYDRTVFVSFNAAFHRIRRSRRRTRRIGLYRGSLSTQANLILGYDDIGAGPSVKRCY
ncbi:MAG: hypothetical protein CM15mP74_18830 [Halieaceae bacterium]|nr:MAG: hypothetical protein CM15mP74_18830 [Halieaceae bacterium]